MIRARRAPVRLVPAGFVQVRGGRRVPDRGFVWVVPPAASKRIRRVVAPSRGFVRGIIAVVLAAASARGPSRGFAAARRRARPSGRGPSTRGPGASLGVAVVPADPPDPLTATTASPGGRETPEHGPGATPERGAVLVAGDVHGDIRTAAGVIGPGPAPTAPTRAGPGSRHASSARTM